MQTRGIPMRNRRDVNGDAKAEATQTISDVTNEIAVVRQRRNSHSTDTASTNVNIAPQMNQARDKRDAPECVVNYKAQRSLLIGCSQPDIIDVRPKCNDDGDEGI